MVELLFVKRNMILLPIDVARANVNHLLHLSLASRHQEVQSPERIDCESVEHLSPGFWNNCGCGEMKSNIYTFQSLEKTLIILNIPHHRLRFRTQVDHDTMGRTDEASQFRSATVQ